MAFLYRHIRLDKNEPFYIGIGSKNNYDRAYCVKKRNRIWNSIYSTSDIEVEIIVDGLNWEQIKEKEVEFIKLYGRIDNNTGILANLTNGGAGMLGFKFSKSARANMSKAQKLKAPVSEETRKKLSLASTNRIGPWKGKKFSKEHIDNIKQSLVGKKKPIIECPHCKKIGGASQMKQWHFKNCKLKNI